MLQHAHLSMCDATHFRIIAMCVSTMFLACVQHAGNAERYSRGEVCGADAGSTWGFIHMLLMRVFRSSVGEWSP
jgi:hypothetical protein